jgi:hypothetical protein
MIGGIVNEADVTELVVSLTIHLNREGHRTVTISNNPIGGIFGFGSIQDILRDTSMGETNKINKMNQYINGLVARKRPDVLMIEAPDAIMKYNETVHNGYGIHTYMLCESVQPDRLVCCIPYELAFDGVMQKFDKHTRARYNIPISMFHVSNILIDGAEIDQQKKIEYTFNDMSYVDTQLERMMPNETIPLLNAINDDGMKAYELLFHKGGSTDA